MGDVRDLNTVLDEAQIERPLDAAAVVMALQDLDPIAPVLAGAAQAVRPGGRVVLALTHPCFRIPRRSTWGWDEALHMRGTAASTATSRRSPPHPHPSRARGRGEHQLLPSAAGRVPQRLRRREAWGGGAATELVSHRRAGRGPRWSAEDHSAREFPLFLVLTCVRLP